MKRSFTLLALVFVTASVYFSSCRKSTSETSAPQPLDAFQSKGAKMRHTKQYSGQVATAWFDMATEMARTTPGFGPGVAGRALAYSGVALYESVLPGMPSYQSLFQLRTGFEFPVDQQKDYYWPAAANAAMGEIVRKFFTAANPANKAAAVTLETSNLASYQTEADAATIQRSISFGTMVADSIYAWSLRDGGTPPYTVYNPVLPVPPGEWVPTAPAFAPGVTPEWGNFRSFVPNAAALTQPGPPTPYSATPGSDFYNMALEVYQRSTNLSASDLALVQTWADLPNNFNGHTHLTRVLTQLLRAENFDLEKTAAAYAQHGMAVNDATISCFRTKYHYKLVRPITYIRNVLGHSSYNTVIPTPPHPEYSAAHAAITGASATILKYYFGDSYPFTDHTHDALYGPRSYHSITEYEEGSGWSRVLAGVHYVPSVNAGLAQGRAVGALVLAYPLKKP